MAPVKEEKAAAREARKVSLQRLLDRVPEAHEDASASGGGSGNGGQVPPPTGGGYEEIDRERGFSRATGLGGTAVALLATKACSWNPSASSDTLVAQLGKWAYVAIVALCAIYFFRMLLAAPLRPDWYKHVELARKAANSIVLVLAIGTVQALVSDWNRAEHTDWRLPDALFATFLPVFLFATYSVLVRMLSTVRLTMHDSAYAVGDARSRPVLRYALTVLFMSASLLSLLLATRRILEVFRAFPATWYEPYLPWLWFK